MAHVSLNHPKLTLEGAEAILDAAKAQAARIGVPMNIAVVDDGGFLMAFARMDGAKPASIDIAFNKAHAAAIRRQNTGPARSGDEVTVIGVPSAEYFAAFSKRLQSTLATKFSSALTRNPSSTLTVSGWFS